MIGDGDCLQIGIGGIPNAVLAMHRRPPAPGHPHGDAHRRHRGVSTATGAIDGSRKAIMPGKHRVQLRGRHPGALRLRPRQPARHRSTAASSPTIPCVIGQNDNVVAVNSALQIDLTGQVDADSIGRAHLLGHRRPGRLHPRGVAEPRRAPDHRACRARRMNGTVSRIVPTPVRRRRRGDEPGRRAPRGDRARPRQPVRHGASTIERARSSRSPIRPSAKSSSGAPTSCA